MGRFAGRRLPTSMRLASRCRAAEEAVAAGGRGR